MAVEEFERSSVSAINYTINKSGEIIKTAAQIASDEKWMAILIVLFSACFLGFLFLVVIKFKRSGSDL